MKADEEREGMKKRSKGGTPELDLHGFSRDAASEAILQFLSDMIIAGNKKVHIIHGRGTGQILNTTHQTLQKTDVVRKYLLHERNPGVTVVYL